MSPLSPASRELALEWIKKLRSNLWGSVLPFWMSHSIDAVNGGFFNNLDEDGTVFDTTKHVWLQGRQVWMFARIANTYTEDQISALTALYPAPVPRVGGPSTPLALTRANLISTAKAGVEFLRAHAYAPDGSVYFALTMEGAPVLNQRKPFSAFFFVMALSEIARATGDMSYAAEAETLMDTICRWDSMPGGCEAALGKPSCPGAPALFPLNMPMIFLNVRREMIANQKHASPESAAAYRSEVRERSIADVLAHVDAKRRAVFENVGPDGPDLSIPAGRLLNPGHAIEAAWFLLDEACSGEDSNPQVKQFVAERALEAMDIAWENGWDGDLGDGRIGIPSQGNKVPGERGDHSFLSGSGSGGFIYFRDVAGFSPTLLEKNMKLWWPQAEALIAFSKALAYTGDDKYMQSFDRVATWVWEFLVTDREWYGYADRTGSVTHRFKGGPYKGCFHVPRALLYAEQALLEALERE